MKVEEIQILVIGLIDNGPEETYNKMRAKAFMSIDTRSDVDEMFLDMSEILSKKAKEEVDNDNDDNPSLANIYSTLSFMLRRLAHEVYRKYIKMGDKRNNERFLRLASYNEKVSLMI
jgi:hypothetical protein